jgi:hypothetical protein
MPGCIVLPWNVDAMKHLRIILIYNGFRWLQLESFIQFCCVETTPLEVIADASLGRPDHKHVRMGLIIISKDDYAELETFLLTINFIIALYRCLSAHLLYNSWLFYVSVFHTKHYWYVPCIDTTWVVFTQRKKLKNGKKGALKENNRKIK